MARAESGVGNRSLRDELCYSLPRFNPPPDVPPTKKRPHPAPQPKPPPSRPPTEKLHVVGDGGGSTSCRYRREHLVALVSVRPPGQSGMTRQPTAPQLTWACMWRIDPKTWMLCAHVDVIEAGQVKEYDDWREEGGDRAGC